MNNRQDTNDQNIKDQNVDVNDQDLNEYDAVEKVADNQNLIDCYQIQVDNDNNCSPVYLGKYPEVPLPVHQIFKFKKYRLHVVTYVLTDDEIENNIFKIVGVNVFRQNRKNSLCSLDLALNPDKNGYQLLFNDHATNESNIVEKIEKFPGKDLILEYIINKAFEDPVKSRLLDR